MTRILIGGEEVLTAMAIGPTRDADGAIRHDASVAPRGHRL
jgi:hypothetical protein